MIVLLILTPQLLLQYLMQGSETCYTVQTCIGHAHKGSGILIQVIIAELYPFKPDGYINVYLLSLL